MAMNTEKLQALQSKLKQQTTSSKEMFSDLVVVHIGIEPTEFYPKLKNSDGSKVKDEFGNDKRSETQEGWTYTFIEMGTGRTVKIVNRERLKIELLNVYRLSGLGYNIKQSRFIFIDENAKILNY